MLMKKKVIFWLSCFIVFVGITAYAGPWSGGGSGSGAGTITDADANTYADVADKVVVANSTDAACFIAFFDAATGNMAVKTNTAFGCNATTGAISATTFVGNLTGDVTGNVTGDVTGTASGNLKKAAAAFSTDFVTCTDASGDLYSCGAKVDLSSTITQNVETSGYLAGRMRAIIITAPSGTSTDVPSETVLTHADDGSAANAYIGMTLYNVTDSVSGTVTASTSTTITVAAGSMSWANTNVYQLGPGPAQSGSIFYVGAAGTLRHPATVGYLAGYYQTTTGVLIINPASDTMVITNATASAIDAGNAIDGPATAGAFIWLHNASATLGYAQGKNGTWTDGGAD
jgi:hypothetical protein